MNTKDLPPTPEPSDIGYETRWAYTQDDLINYGIDVANHVESIAQKEIERLRTENAILQQKSDRYDWLDENAIWWKPPGYDGCDLGRFDAYWFSEESDLATYIDSQLKKEQK